MAESSAANPFRRLAEFTTVPDPLAAEVLNRNDLGHRAPAAPMYLFDELIPYAGVQALRRTWCAGGTKIHFYTDLLSEHVVLAGSGAPAAVAYPR